MKSYEDVHIENLKAQCMMLLDFQCSSSRRISNRPIVSHEGDKMSVIINGTKIEPVSTHVYAAFK